MVESVCNTTARTAPDGGSGVGAFTQGPRATRAPLCAVRPPSWALWLIRRGQEGMRDRRTGQEETGQEA